jgi:hypothetical protein
MGPQVKVKRNLTRSSKTFDRMFLLHFSSFGKNIPFRQLITIDNHIVM